jgi:hypothetical protein
MPCR